MVNAHGTTIIETITGINPSTSPKLRTSYYCGLPTTSSRLSPSISNRQPLFFCFFKVNHTSMPTDTASVSVSSKTIYLYLLRSGHPLVPIFKQRQHTVVGSTVWSVLDLECKNQRGPRLVVSSSCCLRHQPNKTVRDRSTNLRGRMNLLSGSNHNKGLLFAAPCKGHHRTKETRQLCNSRSRREVIGNTNKKQHYYFYSTRASKCCQGRQIPSTPQRRNKL